MPVAFAVGLEDCLRQVLPVPGTADEAPQAGQRERVCRIGYADDQFLHGPAGAIAET